MKKIGDLKWQPMWVSHLGCVKGCLDYLGIDMSDAWLFGGTGHAFIINMAAEGACPSGPTAWNTEMLGKLGKNLGYETDGLFGMKSQEDFMQLQDRAWSFAREKLDQGQPCYAWELEIPEFYVINGYDHVGYYFSGPECDDGKGPKPWNELGDTGIGIIEMYSLKSVKAADDRVVVCEALKFTLEHSQGPEKWIFPEYRSGLAGFDAWIDALESGSATRMGHAYNAAVWEECRRLGLAFLREAKSRLKNGLAPLFDEAIAHYEIVAQKLKLVTELFPFFKNTTDTPIPIDDQSRLAVDALRMAKQAESKGLEALQSIVDRLS